MRSWEFAVCSFPLPKVNTVGERLPMHNGVGSEFCLQRVGGKKHGPPSKAANMSKCSKRSQGTSVAGPHVVGGNFFPTMEANLRVALENRWALSNTEFGADAASPGRR